MRFNAISIFILLLLVVKKQKINNWNLVKLFFYEFIIFLEVYVYSGFQFY